MEGVLGDAISAISRVVFQARFRTDIYDLAVMLGAHDREHCARSQERAAQVDCLDTIPFLDLVCVDRTTARDGGLINQDINLPEALQAGLYQTFDITFV